MADRVRRQALEVAHPNAAGIDIGSKSLFVAVRPDLHEQPVRVFSSSTEDFGSAGGGASKHNPNRPAQALRMAAVTAGRTQSALGAYCRCLAARFGKAKAIRATVHMLFRLIYTLVAQGRPTWVEARTITSASIRSE